MTPRLIDAPIDRRRLEIETNNLPEEVESAPGKLGKLGTEYRALFDRAREALQHLHNLNARQDEAQITDRRALRDAMREGSDDPGSPAADALAAEIDAAEREAAGVLDAVNLTWHEFIAAILEGADEWRAQLEDEHDKAVVKARKSITPDTIHAVARCRGQLAWLSDAVSSARGDALKGGAIKRRFPTEPNVHAMVHIGPIIHPVEDLLALIVGWIDGDAS